MYNALIALALGFVAFAACFFSGWLRFGEALAPGILVTIVAFVALGFRTAKQLRERMNEAGSDLQNQRFDAAIATLKKGYALQRWQFGIAGQIDSQIGMILYLRKEFKEAIPYLERAKTLGHWLGTAMLAVAYYKKKDHQRMRQTFEGLVSKFTVRKEGLAWNLYAYLLSQIGDVAGAQAVLARGDAATKGDAKVKENLLNVQNGKKIKMKGYAEQWWQFHLEVPPQLMPDGRSMFSARRRR